MPIKIKRKNGKVTRYKNAEYIPLFYFLPKSLLDKCGELPFRISRYPYKLFTDWKQIELIESDQFALLMYDAFHYLVWEYMGLNVGREQIQVVQNNYHQNPYPARVLRRYHQLQDLFQIIQE